MQTVNLSVLLKLVQVALNRYHLIPDLDQIKFVGKQRIFWNWTYFLLSSFLLCDSANYLMSLGFSLPHMKYETGILVEVIDLRGMGRVGAFR